MSKTEYHTGVLTPVPLGNNTTEELAKHLLGDLYSRYLNELDWYDSLREFFNIEMYGKYIWLNNSIYHVQNTEVEDNLSAWRTKDGNIAYSVSFYNGGAILYECVEDAVDYLLDTEHYSKSN